MKSNLNYSDIQSHPKQKSRKQTTKTNQQGREGKGTLLTADVHQCWDLKNASPTPL